MTTPIFVLGGWQSDFAESAPGGEIFGLLERATRGALGAAGLEAHEIQVAHVGNLAAELFVGQAHLGAMLVSVDPAFDGMPSVRHEAACASGSAAALAAMADLEAGH